MTALSWFLRPNWASSVKVNYEFKTDIIPTRAGDEQRRALRATPRKTIEIQATALHENDVAFFHRYIATWQPIALYVPETPLIVRPIGEISSAGTTFTADRAIPNWLIPGVILMFSTGQDTFTATVVSVDTGTLLVSVNAGPTIDFPAMRTRICPMRLAYFPDTITLQRALRSTADGTIVFEVEPTSEDELTPAAPFFTFETAEVFLEIPDFTNPLEETLAWVREIVDGGQGPTKRYTPAPRQVRSLKATYWRRGSAYALTLLDFFLRMRGMQGEFNMPTYDKDIFPGYPVASGDAFIREPGTLLADSWVRGWPYRHIMIELSSGTRYYRRTVEIHSVTDGLGTDSILTVDTPIPEDIVVVDIVRVSWVPTWRFATDQLTLEWRTDELATVSMAFRTVETILGDSASQPSTLGRVVFLHAGLTNWTVPDDLDPDIEAVVYGVGAGSGGGAGLRDAFLIGISGNGGAGGAFPGPLVLPLTPGGIIPVAIGSGGAGSTTPGAYNGADGGDTRFGIGLGVSGADLLFAEGGHTNTGGLGEGGRASVSIPTGGFSGGNGGANDAASIAAPGGGGAGGPHGDGAVGASSAPGGGGAGGGAADGGTDGLITPGAGIGGHGGAAQDGTAGGVAGIPGLHGSGGGGGRAQAGLPGGAGGGGGDGAPVWTETLGGTSAGPGGGGGGGAGGSNATNGGNGGQGGSFGGGGGAGGCGTTETVGIGGSGGNGLIIIEYTARG